MTKKECIAMLLAGGQGSRLRVLTRNQAKPAVPFGGQYRIIDFSLSNCAHSGIDTVGVLTQYKPQTLNSHIGFGSNWDLAGLSSGVTILSPYVGDEGGSWYKGTAHAVYENLKYVDTYETQYVLIISGDHVYQMDYSLLLEYHKEKHAEATIAVVEVPWQEASRFGIMNLGEDGVIEEFEEKPAFPKSNLASMGVYIFNKSILAEYLNADVEDASSANDFGKNIIPKMLKEERRLFAYPFKGYWRDVGTVESYWLASMDILDEKDGINIFDSQWGVYSFHTPQPPQYVGASAQISDSLISEGVYINGSVEHSIVFPGVQIHKNAIIKDSIILPNVKISSDVTVEKAIIGENTWIGEGSVIGDPAASKSIIPKVTLIEDNLQLEPNSSLSVLQKKAQPKSNLIEAAGV